MTRVAAWPVRVAPRVGGPVSHQPPCHVGGLLLVGVRVLHHPIFADEAFATDIASEGFLPCV